MSANSQLATCVLEVVLCLMQQLLEQPSSEGSSYAVGESVMARRMDGDFVEGTVLDALEGGHYLVMWNEEEVAAKLAASELMPFGSGMGLSSERRQRVAPAFILNNFLMKTAIPSNDLSRVQMVVRDGADVNCTDSDGNSPLNLAVSNGASVALIQFLISRGAHVNFVGAAGSALQIAAIQDNVEAVRCLLAHGADPGLVDLEAAAEESVELLRESLIESEVTPAASQSPLTPEELEAHAAECFTQLLPALLGAMANTQSPKLHKRVLMVLCFAVQRATAKQLGMLTSLQLGSLLSALRALLSSGNSLEAFAALRMLTAGLASWPALGSAARRHGIDLLLNELIDSTATAAAAPEEEQAALLAAAGQASSRAQSMSLKPQDILSIAESAKALLDAVPVTAAESSVLATLRALPAEGQKSFSKASAKLAALLLGEEAPSAHELKQSGTLSWLLGELALSARPAELRQRWADFERAFGARLGVPGSEALEQLVALLHNTLAACESLPVHTYASPSDGAHSLKPLSEPIQICLHPMVHGTKGAPTGGSGGGGSPSSSGLVSAAADTADGAPSMLSLSIDPLVRVGQVQQHLLRTASVHDTAYEAFCTRLLGCVVEERPMPHDGALGGAAGSGGVGGGGGVHSAAAAAAAAAIGGGGAPFRRATVTNFRSATPLKLPLHTLVYDDGREADVVLATRQYRIIGKVSKESLERKRAASRESSANDGTTVADPEARIHTVTIACPEGLPVDLFLENVLSVVRRALRQAEPGAAPMSRAPSDEYGWRDRGWDRGGAQFERTVAEKLRDNGVAAVARRQTKAEAETLLRRLSGTVMASIEVEQQSTQADDGEDLKDKYPLHARVQGLVAGDAPAMAAMASANSAALERPSGERLSHGGERSSNTQEDGAAQWLAATVVESGAGGVSLVYDEGVFEACVPSYRVRAVPQPESKQRLNPLAAIFMSFEQFLSSREERRAEYELNSRDTQPANLRRTLSAFQIGRVQQVGRVPRAAIDDDAMEGDGEEDEDEDEGGGGGSGAMDTSPIEPPAGGGSSSADDGMCTAPFDIAPMRLCVRFALGTASEVPTPDAGICFDESCTLLHCLQLLRESTASGRRAALEPQELGYHPGVTCDRTGMNPIVGNRYKLRDENYDVCEAEYLKMPEDEQEQYQRIPPPVYRKPKGHGPAKWHLYHWIEVAGEGTLSLAASSPRAGGGSETVAAATPKPSCVGATTRSQVLAAAEAAAAASEGIASDSPRLLASPKGGATSSPTSSVALAWTAREVEAGLLSGRLEPELVLRELRRALHPGTELRLSEGATRVLAGSYGTALAPLCSAQLMAVFREVSGTPRAAVASSAPVPAPTSLSALRGELRSAHVPDGEFADVVCLLWLLTQRILRDSCDDDARGGAGGGGGDLSLARTVAPSSDSTAAAAAASADRNERRSSHDGFAPPSLGAIETPDATARRLLTSALLSAKLQRQLTDALAVSSGALPQWARLLIRRCPALFSARARSMYFRSSAFGVSRAVHWSQEAQVSSVRSAYAEELAALERARLEAELGEDVQGLAEVVEQQTEIEDRVGRERLGALRSDIARVDRERLLPMACKLMALHASSRHALEIQFEGESGFGSGVTQNFYSATANELLKVGVNQALPVWICDLPAGQHADSTIVHHGELFPLPLTARMPAARQAQVCERFRFLGRLMAKACRDSFIVPLPLSKHFLRLVRGETLTYYALPPPGATGGVASGYAGVCQRLSAIDAEGATLGEAERRRRYEREADREFASSCLGMGTRLSLREWLQAGGCAFVCPLTGEPLCEGGEERELTVHNLQEYVHLLSQLWLADGVIAQAAAFREGLEEVFPLETLALFTVSELQTVLCGTMSIEWTEAELQRHLHPSGGYTKHSKVYQFLIDELQRMGNESRAKFLNFVTACPHLPPVGLSMLEIEVLPQHSGSAFPTAQTCGNKLYLPEYDTAEELRGGLAEAFANTEAGGLHEHAG